MDSDVDIRQFSVRHIFFRYRNNRCRCRMSDIADIEIDVGAHCLPMRYTQILDAASTGPRYIQLEELNETGGPPVSFIQERP